MKPVPTSRLILFGLAIALVIVACGGERELAGFVREPLPDVSGHSLPEAGAEGEPFEFVAGDDGLLVVYFGYTYCPDVCPTTMSDLRKAVAALNGDAGRVEIAMATVDPNRDEPDVISNYVHAFFEDGHALRTIDENELRVVADAFGAVYSVTETEDGDIEVVHSGFAYVVDDQGRVRVTWPFGTASEDMTSDMEILLAEAA